MMMAALAVVVMVLGCRDSHLTSGPEPAQMSKVGSSPQLQLSALSIDDAFADMAVKLPGFAGAYFDERGDLIVRLVDRKWESEAVAAVAPLASRAIDALSSTRVISADYDFRQLNNWKQIARMEILPLPGVITLDVDEVKNRLFIGVEDTQLIPTVESALQTTSIPKEAVVMGEASVPKLALRDRVRPVVGGLQIDSDKGECTLGFNAVRNDTLLFSTAGHCSDERAVVDLQPQTFHQPDYPDDLIGTEYQEEPWDFGPNCPSGRQCKYADFLLATYEIPEDSVVVGQIARPTYRGRWQGSVEMSTTNPHFLIRAVDHYPVTGEWLEKVGRTTGWTYGYVIMSCVDWEIETQQYHIIYYCTNGAMGGVGDGDSGAPVFKWWGSSSDNVTLYGTVFGETKFYGTFDVFLFVSYGNLIEAGFGPFDRVTYIDPPPPPSPPEVEIKGPIKVLSGDLCEWTADITGGAQPYQSIIWSGVLSGSGESIWGELTSGGVLYVVVTDAEDQTDVDSHHITIDPAADPCFPGM
jgi:hypothetical protein